MPSRVYTINDGDRGRAPTKTLCVWDRELRIIIKTHKLSRLLATVLLATALTACSSFERSGREDTRITRNVISELRNEPHLDVSGIRVETDNGTVQLSGTVKSQDEKERAGRVAREVNGVKRVENDLKVR